MAARKTGLGKGLDGLFPSYNKKADAGTGQAKTGTTGKSPVNREKKVPETDTDVAADGKKPADASHSVMEVDINEVEPNPDQPRKQFEGETLEELASSIRQYGVIQPLVVQKRDDYYEIIAGERRWRAARIAGLKKIPVVIRDYSGQEIVEISLIENIQREDLNPIEEALAYERLIDEYGLTQEEVAQKVSKNRSTITNSLRLLKLDKRVAQMLTDGEISSGHARALLGIEDPDRQYETAMKVRDEHLSVRDIERLIKTLSRPPKQSEPEVSDTTAMDLICRDMEEKMKSALGTRVTVNRKNDQKGTIKIEYYSNEELERIFDLLSSVHA